MEKFSLMRSVLILSTLLSAGSWAQQTGAGTLKEAAQAAVLKNPEVQARWHGFREAAEEIGVARGGFMPRLDVSYGAGREKIVQNNTRTDLSYRDNQTQTVLKQMLFDGFATLSEVKRFDRARLVRYFELLDTFTLVLATTPGSNCA